MRYEGPRGHLNFELVTLFRNHGADISSRSFTIPFPLCALSQKRGQVKFWTICHSIAQNECITYLASPSLFYGEKLCLLELSLYLVRTYDCELVTRRDSKDYILCVLQRFGTRHQGL